MKFGVREIVDVVFKATANNQKVGEKYFKKYQPVFMIDTATTSSLEQATTTVYAQGGKGYARLIAWEGEKTMTFTVTDALMSPQGLAVLTGAGLIKPNKNNQAHVHTTLNLTTNASGEAVVTVEDLNEEFGLNAKDYVICNTIEMFATELDGSGAGIAWYDAQIQNASGDYTHIDNTQAGLETATFVVGTKNDDGTFAPITEATTVQLDFYVIMNNSVTEVQIEPEDFGGYFYVEAQTLFRREDTGKDMAAEIIIPKAKVQSAFTFTMAATGDPSTFDFVMDAMPGYTRFDATKKQMCVIQIVGTDDKASDEVGAHVHENPATDDSPSFKPSVTPGSGIDVSKSTKVGTSTIPIDFENRTEYQENQNKATVTVNGSTMTVAISGGVDSLNEWTSTDPGQATYGDVPWIALDIDTGLDDITKLEYNGYPLTQGDVDDAAAWGLGNGHIILWIRADAVQSTPKTINLSGEGYDPVSLTITVTDAA